MSNGTQYFYSVLQHVFFPHLKEVDHFRAIASCYSLSIESLSVAEGTHQQRT